MSDPTEIIEALRLVQQGHWDQAHELVQRRSDPDACRVHALLHRMEGDDGNAGYWYRRAGHPFPRIETEEELAQLINEFFAG